MRELSIAICLAVGACNSVSATSEDAPPMEDCAVPGDEDDNGAADCGDLACANAPVCQAMCADGVRNGLETDVDCGGLCARCELGEACAVDTDCTASSICDRQQ